MTDLSKAFKTLVLVMLAIVEDPAGDASNVEFHRWKSMVKEAEDKTRAFMSFKAKVFLKVEGQCTKTMKGRITRQDEYIAPDTVKDGFTLLKIIEGISIGIEGRHIRW